MIRQKFADYVRSRQYRRALGVIALVAVIQAFCTYAVFVMVAPPAVGLEFGGAVGIAKHVVLRTLTWLVLAFLIFTFVLPLVLPRRWLRIERRSSPPDGR